MTVVAGRGEAGDTRRAVPAGVRDCDVIARREMSSRLIFTWRKQLREGRLAGVSFSLRTFAEVQIAEPTVPVSQPGACPSGFIHIELPDGLLVSVHAGVHADALAQVLSVLRRTS